MELLKKIVIKNAATHNLKQISLEIPKNCLVVITGPSGSGKSSLAFDTIFVEGQRKYIESLSSYARQFLGQYSPAIVDSIHGLSPTIAIDQKSVNKNPRSTVGTSTEIFDYLRVLYAKIGTPHCPRCHKTVKGQNAQQITNAILSEYPSGAKIQILAPLIKKRKGEHKELLASLQSHGFSKIRLDGEIINLDSEISIEKNKTHTLELVIDRLILKKENTQRIFESVEVALKFGKGSLLLLAEGHPENFFSEHNSCPDCNISLPEFSPNSFSFNSPLGACKQCNGIGTSLDVGEFNLIADPTLSIEDGAILPLAKKNTFIYQMVKCIFRTEKINLSTPYNELPPFLQTTLIDGSEKIYNFSFRSERSNFRFKKRFPGVINWILKRYHETESEKAHQELQKFMSSRECPACQGNKLNEFSLGVKIGNHSIMELGNLNIEKLATAINHLSLTVEQLQISQNLLKEISTRIDFLLRVGLGYITLNRPTATLSGGESQRIRLATQIGSSLTGVIYVLDEPSIGLHARDNKKLIDTLKALRDLGNSVLVVEHDEEMIQNADHIIELGPAAGVHGGELIANLPRETALAIPSSLTGKYIRKELQIKIERSNSLPPTQFIHFKKCKINNLKSIDAKIPLARLVAITGVSGSGKSSLLHHVVVPTIKKFLATSGPIKSFTPINCQSCENLNLLTGLVEITQDPIGRTPKSNPVTYTGCFDNIRTIFAQTKEAKAKGYLPGRFSFNVKGGRCESCEGNGIKKIEMHFLPDVFITCTDCKGSRYNDETLSIHYKGKNIAEVLDLTVAEALDFFSNYESLKKTLQVLNKIGLGYLKLGQSATTLSGGEAQRMKLAKELSKKTKGHTLYILDEPTTGLHLHDIKMLLNSIAELVDIGHSVVVIEHHLELIKQCDYIIDLGPEGGERGGELIAEGTIDDICTQARSYTGQLLR